MIDATGRDIVAGGRRRGDAGDRARSASRPARRRWWPAPRCSRAAPAPTPPTSPPCAAPERRGAADGRARPSTASRAATSCWPRRVAARRGGRRWSGGPRRSHHLLLGRPRPEGLAADAAGPAPRRPGGRPAHPGRRLRASAARRLATGPRGDPWDRASPSRRFAEALHGFGWLKDLTAHGDAGRLGGAAADAGLAAAVRALERASPGRRRCWSGGCSTWPAPIRALCRRRPPTPRPTRSPPTWPARRASCWRCDDGPARAAERAAAAAVAGAALGGRGRRAAAGRARCARLAAALPQTVTPDGGHASRSPQAALELLFDLSTLDDALAQRGVAAPDEMARALDRLAGGGAVLHPGRRPAGGASRAARRCRAAYVAAARAQDEAGERADAGRARRLPPAGGPRRCR